MSFLKLSLFFAVLVSCLSTASRFQERTQAPGVDSLAPGLLIPASSTMVSAWDTPRNPFTDSLPASAHLAEQIRYGYKLFTNTPEGARSFGGNKLSCSNCHLNAGQREKALPLVGVYGMFPEYNKRAGRLITLEDRIVECFKRSMDAAGKGKDISGTADSERPVAPTTQSREVLAISAFISWLSSGYPVGGKIAWRGQNTIPQDSMIPVARLDKRRGEMLFKEKCITCHGKDGQGVEIGDKKAGPLWGAQSWNDGAGAARVYTLAGMIRYFMPYLDPGSLSDEEAQQIAAFINSQPRPVYPYKYQDYRKESLPPDALYYRREKK